MVSYGLGLGLTFYWFLVPCTNTVPGIWPCTVTGNDIGVAPQKLGTGTVPGTLDCTVTSTDIGPASQAPGTGTVPGPWAGLPSAGESTHQSQGSGALRTWRVGWG